MAHVTAHVTCVHVVNNVRRKMSTWLPVAESIATINCGITTVYGGGPIHDQRVMRDRGASRSSTHAALTLGDSRAQVAPTGSGGIRDSDDALGKHLRAPDLRRHVHTLAHSRQDACECVCECERCRPSHYRLAQAAVPPAHTV